MTLKIFLTIFITVLFAELGDKTQLATLLFATNKENPKIIVFCAAALALIVATGIAVLLGNAITKYINPKVLSWIAGIGFIIIGIWTIIKS
ncbi:MAG: TMEM165/GDT1 family protein [Candidatus Omnitrophica bacterium]|nr:TMEM165/GDT1 family protein [Candidatus Omnitrophota bacterium]MCK5289028.1 TMEM165/GDT1 family protein [Candidatus Omnitrophota bacterium]